MLNRLIVGTLWATFVLASAHAWSGDAKSMSDELKLELNKSLTEFAMRNSFSQDRLRKLLNSAAMDETKIRKGGVGVINKDVFVLLDEPRNTLRIANRYWKGESFNQAEIVFTDGEKVGRRLSEVANSNLNVIIFAPKEVRFIDPINNTGGRYLRQH